MMVIQQEVDPDPPSNEFVEAKPETRCVAERSIMTTACERGRAKAREAQPLGRGERGRVPAYTKGCHVVNGARRHSL